MLPNIQLVEDLRLKLLAKSWKVVTAESCTGGGLSFWLTSLAGSSDWFERGYITYSNQAKIDLLGVSSNVLSQFGAVSEEVAREMSQKALERSLSQVAISITGIAGPTGGSVDKPVGTVFIGIAGIEITPLIRSYTFKGDRAQIREQAIMNALTQVLSVL